MDTLVHTPGSTCPAAPARPFSPFHLESLLARGVIPGEVLIFPHWHKGMFPPLQSYRTASPLITFAYLSSLAEAPPGGRRWGQSEGRIDIPPAMPRRYPLFTRVYEDETTVHERLTQALSGRHLGVYVATGGYAEAQRILGQLLRIARAHLPAALLSWIIVTDECCVWGERDGEYYSWSQWENPYAHLAQWKKRNIGEMIYERSCGQLGWQACQLYFPNTVSYPDFAPPQASVKVEALPTQEVQQRAHFLLVSTLFQTIDVFMAERTTCEVGDILTQQDWNDLWPSVQLAHEFAASMENVHQRDRLLLGALCGEEFPLETPLEKMGAYLGDYAAYNVDLIRTYAVIALCDGLAMSIPEHAITLFSISAYLCWWVGNMPGAAARLATIGKPQGRYRLARLVRLSVERNFFSPYILAP